MTVKEYKNKNPFCEVCGGNESQAPVHVHHIKTRGSGGLDIEENMMTLCVFCHEEVHRIGRYSFAKKYDLFDRFDIAFGGENWRSHYKDEFIIVCKREGITRQLFFKGWNGTSHEFSFTKSQAHIFRNSGEANRQARAILGMSQLKVVRFERDKIWPKLTA